MEEEVSKQLRKKIAGRIWRTHGDGVYNAASNNNAAHATILGPQQFSFLHNILKVLTNKSFTKHINMEKSFN